ncbi:L-amino acid N-acetyltransferase AaaT [bioreactor metagenome]|uniref:L-amino acid N-acetyltransferase AaaT n=1 Tax=bioreactor metagenome TaxID=1076179 RepID=A0A644XYD3_9ZZZZ
MDFIIRPVKLSDAADIAQLRCMPGVFETTLGHPASRVEQSEKFLAGMGDNSFEFVAEAQGKVIGMGGISIFPGARLRHSAGFGIMVHKEWQNRGVGTAIMKAVLDMADNWLMLERVELGVFADNVGAIRLYERMGFVVEGRKRHAAIKNGEYADEIIMARLLSEQKK